MKVEVDMKIVTKVQLDAIVLRINKITGQPETSYTKTKDGKFKANIGNYHIDSSHGGYKLTQIVSEGCGIKDITHGFVSKRELADLMFAFISGLESKNA